MDAVRRVPQSGLPPAPRFSKDDLEKAALRYHGDVRRIAKQFKVSPRTIYRAAKPDRYNVDFAAIRRKDLSQLAAEASHDTSVATDDTSQAAHDTSQATDDASHDVSHVSEVAVEASHDTSQEKTLPESTPTPLQDGEEGTMLRSVRRDEDKMTRRHVLESQWFQGIVLVVFWTCYILGIATLIYMAIRWLRD
jgi:hypothetical protein